MPGVVLRLVQPNIAQHHKWRQDLRAAQFAKHLRLSTTAARTSPTHVIWAETAAPFVVADDAARRRRMAMVVPAGMRSARPSDVPGLVGEEVVDPLIEEQLPDLWIEFAAIDTFLENNKRLLHGNRWLVRTPNPILLHYRMTA